MPRPKTTATALLAVCLSAASAFGATGAGGRKSPDYWPESEYPAGQKLGDGRTGCRMEMGELLAKYKKEELTIKYNIEDEKGHLGTYAVGDELPYGIAIGPKANKYFGSVKHGRDGGYLDIKITWTDSEGKKVLGTDMKRNKAGC